MGNALAQVRAGIWERPAPPEMPAADGRSPVWGLLRLVAGAKDAGASARSRSATNTKSTDEWRLGYSHRFFAGLPLTRSTASSPCLQGPSAGGSPGAARGHRGRRRSCGTKRTPDRSAQAHFDQEDHRCLCLRLRRGDPDEHRADNPARSKRMHIEVPKPTRTYLEIDELSALLQAAHETGRRSPDLATSMRNRAQAPTRLHGSRRRQAAEPDRRRALALEADRHLSPAAVEIEVGRGYLGRRAVCELLARAGLRPASCAI